MESERGMTMIVLRRSKVTGCHELARARKVFPTINRYNKK